MLKFILQLLIGLAGFFAFMFLMGLLMPVFTHPLVFTVGVVFTALFVINLAVRR